MQTSTSIGVADRFLSWYSAELPRFDEAARQLKTFLEEVLSDANIHFHLVAARPKTVDSMRGKLLRKAYAKPVSQLTDKVGGRIILYHSSQVGKVADLLRGILDVREKDSIDKRQALGLREFGYRSYHLIGTLPARLSSRPQLWHLRGVAFEIQIRSILEHAWAAIDHESVYKSGADLPDELKRRFASLAGVLELLDHEFLQVTEATHAPIDVALGRLRATPMAKLQLDVPHMLAMLEIRRSSGRSFRQAIANGTPFPSGIDQRFVLALRHAGIRSTLSLRKALSEPGFRSAARRYSVAESVLESELSHLAVLALVLGTRRPGMLKVFFPEFALDLALRRALS